MLDNLKWAVKKILCYTEEEAKDHLISMINLKGNESNFQCFQLLIKLTLNFTKIKISSLYPYNFYLLTHTILRIFTLMTSSFTYYQRAEKIKRLSHKLDNFLK